MPENGDALDAKAPGESGIALRIVADRFKDRRVDHPAAAQLDPTGPLAHGAPAAVALPARDVDLSARLGIRKEARTKSDAGSVREHFPSERQQRSLQVRKRDAFVDDERFHLTEGGGVREVEVVPPVHAPGNDDPHGRGVRFHVPDLHRRGMRAQQRPDIVGATCCALEGRSQVQRAGCSAGMLSASKQCHSSSTSGPSTIVNPWRVKIASIRSRTSVSG